LLERRAILTLGLLIFQASPLVHAQGRRGMMMGRQMMMNGGMAGMNGMTFNPNLTPNWARGPYGNPYGNLYGNRGNGSGAYGGGSYGGGGYGGGYSNPYPPDNSQGEYAYSSSQRPKHYRITEPELSPQEEQERIHLSALAWSQGNLPELETRSATALNF